MRSFSLANIVQTCLQDIAMSKGKDDSTRSCTVGMNFKQTDADQNFLDEYLAKEKAVNDKNHSLTTSDYASQQLSRCRAPRIRLSRLTEGRVWGDRSSIGPSLAGSRP